MGIAAMKIISRYPWISAAGPGITLSLILLLPFLGKAHTIDDVTFLLEAQNAIKDPLHPAAFDIVLDANRIRLSSAMVTGPIMAYLLIPSVLLGGAEWAAHLVQLILMALAIYSTVRLGIRLGLSLHGARIAGLILAATPAVAVMATTAMADVAAMAFGVFGMERFLCWREEHSLQTGLLSAAGFSLAALSRPHLLFMIPLAAASLVLVKKKSQSSEGSRSLIVNCIPLLGALIIIFVVGLLTEDPMHAQSNFLHVSVDRFLSKRMASNLIAFGIHWMLVLPLALPWIIMRTQWRKAIKSGSAWTLIISAIVISIMLGGSKYVSLILLLSLAGFIAVLDITINAWGNDPIQSMLGIWLFLALPAVGYDHFPAKVAIISAPAVAILIARTLIKKEPPIFRHAIAVATILCGITLSLLIIKADARFAGFGRDAAAEIIAPYVRRGVKVWANGGWGFMWYARKAGAIPIAAQPPHPSSGDLLVSSAASIGLPLDMFPHRTLIRSRREMSRFGRIMSRREGVGFYSNSWGYFPWTWRNGEIENITVWRIN